MCQITKEMSVSAEEFCRLSFHCQYVLGGDGKLRQKTIQQRFAVRTLAKIGKEVFLYVEKPSAAVIVCTSCSSREFSEAEHVFTTIHGFEVAVTRPIALYLKHTKAKVSVVEV